MAVIVALLALAAGCSSSSSTEPEIPAGTAGPAELEVRIAELERQLEAGSEVEVRLATLESVATRLQSDLVRRTKQQTTNLRKLREDFDTLLEDLEKAKEEEAKAAEGEPDVLQALTKDVKDIRQRLTTVSKSVDEAASDAGDALASLQELELRVGALEATQGVGRGQ